MNKNNKNNKLDILSKILLVVIILSFVFSSIALGRSCSINTASADVIQSETYTVFTLLEPDVVGANSKTYNNIDTSSYYAFSSDNTSVFMVFEYFAGKSAFLSASSITSTLCYMNIYEDYDSFIGFDGIYYYVIDGFFVFCLDNFGVDFSSISLITCTVPDLDFELYSYEVTYEPVEPDEPEITVNDTNNVYALFGGATATYIFDASFWGGDTYTVSAPVDIDIDANRIYFSTLYDLVDDIYKEYSFVSNGSLTAYDYLYISIPYAGNFDVFKLELGNFPFLVGSSAFVGFGNGSFDNVVDAVTYIRNYYGQISLYNGNMFIDGSSTNIVSYDLMYVSGVYPSNPLAPVSSTDVVSIISMLNSSFIIYGSSYTLGYETGYNDAMRQFGNAADTAYEQGYAAGAIYGAAHANEYTFFGLISAVVDAPIQAVTGLLNFEFLGINLFAFFTGLLTVALILFIVKKILGG